MTYGDCDDRMTPLQAAIMGKHLHIVKYLIQEGGENVDEGSGVWLSASYITPIALASLHGEPAIVRYLADKGADTAAIAAVYWRKNAINAALAWMLVSRQKLSVQGKHIWRHIGQLIVDSYQEIVWAL